FQDSWAPNRRKAAVERAALTLKPSSTTVNAKPRIQADMTRVRRRTISGGISSSAASEASPKALSTAAAITARSASGFGDSTAEPARACELTGPSAVVGAAGGRIVL